MISRQLAHAGDQHAQRYYFEDSSQHLRTMRQQTASLTKLKTGQTKPGKK